ncbi:uncharacterized protein A4U43_C05F34880 [Asparagus officinalis]|uniref:Uncharacterized protein n=1 Tax=Asparagus officinalis TaxID=4686 RepID=A0A5P1F1I1_ASPOF|nr:uncharacterized protein LOC109841336 [Asparagus officinalis]ONK70551.1 uncharacterized protein A4U43_C05F34880 [Asparagus officinalis]
MSSSNSHKRRIQSLDLQDNQHANPKWKDAVCSICLEFPHNCVLLNCSSYEKGCRPFICDTNHNHSNCLDRFKAAYKLPITSTKASLSSNPAGCPTCPLCRGAVTGWVVIDEARLYFNSMKRSCEEIECSYIGNYAELQSHAKQNHPNARPSEVDPARRLDWENFQQSSEIIDVLSTIHSEVPNSLVFGDYVIEYGDESADEYEDFPGDEGNWWTSCILYQVFDNFRASRSRRRSRAVDFRRGQQRSAYDASNVDDGSISPPDFGEHRFRDSDDDFVTTRVSGDRGSSSSSSGHRSYRRRRSRPHDP